MTQPESRTVEERLAAALWDAFSTKPHAEHVPGDCSTCDAYRELANQDAGLILAVAKEHGLVIGEGELDGAWKEAEAALPEGWWLRVTQFDDSASAVAFRVGTGPYSERSESGATPVAALRALAERLRR